MTRKSHVTRDVAAVVPIGGDGTRFNPASLDTRKHLIYIANHPVLGASLHHWIYEGVRDIVFGATGYENRVQTKRFFGGGGRYPKLSADVTLSFCNYDDREFLKRGSADVFMWAIDEYAEMMGKRDILLINGDNLSTTTLDEFYQAHHERDAIMTLGVKGFNINDPRVRQFGTVVFDEQRRITDFAEKAETPISKYVNTAICLFSPKIRGLLRSHDFCKMLEERRASGKLDVGGHLLPALAEYRAPAYAHVLTGPWADIGTPDSFTETTSDILHGKYPNLRYPDHHNAGNSQIHNETFSRIRGKKVAFEGYSIVDRQARFGERVRVRDSVVGENVVIGSDVAIDDTTTLFPFSRVDGGSKLRQAIVGSYTTVDRDCVIEPGAFLGDNLHLPPGTVITADMRVARNYHRKKVEDARINGKPMYQVVADFDFDAFGFREVPSE